MKSPPALRTCFWYEVESIGLLNQARSAHNDRFGFVCDSMRKLLWELTNGSKNIPHEQTLLRMLTDVRIATASEFDSAKERTRQIIKDLYANENSVIIGGVFNTTFDQPETIELEEAPVVFKDCRPMKPEPKLKAKKEQEEDLSLHKVESGANALIDVPIIHGSNGRGALADAIKQLACGQIGDSFVTNRNPSTVVRLVKIQGGGIIFRVLDPNEKDYKKKRYRVWRSDDLSMDEVNEVIRKRRIGETVPKPKIWVPMTSEQMLKWASKTVKDRRCKVKETTAPTNAVIKPASHLEDGVRPTAASAA
jgi:hypothetical protein